MAGIGAFVGWQGTLVTLVVASVLGTACVAAWALTRREVRGTTAIPFGPFLAAGAILVAVTGIQSFMLIDG